MLQFDRRQVIGGGDAQDPSTPVDQKEVKAFMSRFKAGDRVYHVRENEPDGYEGRCTILEITDEIHASVRWEDSEDLNVVEIRDLFTEEEAEGKGLI